MGSACSASSVDKTAIAVTGDGVTGSDPGLEMPPVADGGDGAAVKLDPLAVPPGLPRWGKLRTKGQISLVKKDPALAILALDFYWLAKVQKYVVGGKLPAASSSSKGDAAWSLLLQAQAHCQQTRRFIWEETQMQSWQRDMEFGEGSGGVGGGAEKTDRANEQRDGEFTSISSSGLGAPQKGLGKMAGAKSSALQQSSGVSAEQEQIESLKFLSVLIKRMRAIQALLAGAKNARPECTGRAVVYKRALDHLLELEQTAEPFRRTKLRVDKQVANLCKLQIRAHEQQLRQWQEEEAKWDAQANEEDDDETQGLLSGKQSSSSNPAFS